MSFTKKLLALAVVGGLAATLAACSSGGGSGSTDSAGADCNVGISMPTRSLERWINDGEGLQKKLQDAGCTVDLQYADNKTEQQISQIQNQVASGAKILVIAAIDGETLGPVLDEAKKQDVTVIAYDRLINGSPNVDYYATFDNYKVGQLQGQYIEEQLGLKDGKGPYNFEPFAGSPDDNNAGFFFHGAWDVLEPYVKSGQLVVPSGKIPEGEDGWKSIGILGWGSDDAQAEMDNRLSSFYSGGQKVDVVLSPNDSLALGIEQSLKSAGYKAGEGWPVITGQDADKANVKAILDGEQSMTVWKDTRELGDRVFQMIQQINGGQEVEVNDTETYDNGEKVVPAYLLDPQVVVKDDVQKLLIDSGFLQASDVGL
ncbi:ABC transporter substrate-binding protein [Humibacter sp. BT305]|uniref:multiple monosaccharide ABC transporter substrate-binding protein n=1 Tax=Cnuibacter physcomitrellae TaxID=1619308 RepID=UPI000E0C03FB|nr:multiple monosaccharide ABC transporter substrate-binding protein [Cnuibacter physcomitrellae]AXH34045.1 ABC transporter substrate-binding protein [Humibacter sp. BT305]MCS5498156.1 sugar ABC transporter substrate-binding protein [Cnuibacter physcomitrellae]GGI40668.1 sugar ABC transporter substrate-binding protein [Cnuibacter physcomitrellae]